MYIRYLTLVISLIFCAQAMETPEFSTRAKEIEEGTFIGTLPVELREELDKYKGWNQFLKELTKALGVERTWLKNLTYLPNSLDQFANFIEKHPDNFQRNYAFNKLQEILNRNEKYYPRSYFDLLEQVAHHKRFASYFFKYSPKQYWIPTFHEMLKDPWSHSGDKLIEYIVEADVLSKNELLNAQQIAIRPEAQALLQKALTSKQ